jgi:hypothetical protein
VSITFTVPVTLVTRAVTGQDNDGNDVYGQTTSIVAGVFAPGDANGTAANEARDARETVVIGAACYLPAPPPTAVDAVIINGDAYEVDGNPVDWSVQPHPFTGWIPEFPVVVRLKRVTG